MCVKNSLVGIKSMNSAHSEINVILNEFQRVRREDGIVEVPIAHFLITTNLLKEDIYKALHLLIEYGVIIKSEYIECPHCLNEEKIIDGNFIKRCRRCREYFGSENIIEKFVLKTIHEN